MFHTINMRTIHNIGLGIPIYFIHYSAQSAFQWPIAIKYYVYLYYLISLDYLSLRQLWYYIPNCVYPNPLCQLSLWEETRAPETHDFRQSVDRLRSERWSLTNFKNYFEIKTGSINTRDYIIFFKTPQSKVRVWETIILLFGCKNL